MIDEYIQANIYVYIYYRSSQGYRNCTSFSNLLPLMHIYKTILPISYLFYILSFYLTLTNYSFHTYATSYLLYILHLLFLSYILFFSYVSLKIFIYTFLPVSSPSFMLYSGQYKYW